MDMLDYESWVVERGGDVIEKRSTAGPLALSSWERLMYCLWVADYMMRNAGDLANADDIYPAFQTDGVELADNLALHDTRAFFALPPEAFQAEYFSRLESVCRELRGAERVGA